jgi:phosphoglycolate phosphatase-like HAD superfamily hydrolase
LQEWEAFADQVWFVGDSVDDMLCGHAAGCKTCLVLTDYNKDLLTRDPPVVDLAVNTLTEFADHIGIVLDVK